MLQAAFSSPANKALSNGHASSMGEFGNICMNGSEVFKFAVRAVPSVSPQWAFLACKRKRRSPLRTADALCTLPAALQSWLEGRASMLDLPQPSRRCWIP